MPDPSPMPAPASPAPGVPSPGPTGPASVGVQNQGNLLRGRVLAGMAMTFLDQAHALLSSKTEEGQTVLKMLNAGSKHFGPPPKDLATQELKLAQSRLSPMGGLQGGGGNPMAAVQQRASQLGLGAPRGPYAPRTPQMAGAA